MTSELKHCPFCGPDGVLDERSPYTVECSVCGCEAWAVGRERPGRPNWNHRPIEDALRAEVEALKHYQELDGLAMRLANNELAKRRREIAALKAECAEAWRVHSEVVAELKAKLAKYTEPLTDEQARRACAIVARESGVYVADPAHEWDAAIRVARLEVR